MAMSVGGNTRGKAEINVTPLIDVLLVLLIIFMIIIPTPENGLNTLVPQPPKTDRDQPAVVDDIVITVVGDGTVRLNQESVSVTDLPDRLGRLFASALNHPVFLRGGPDLEFREIAQVIDIAKGVGITRIALLTK